MGEIGWGTGLASFSDSFSILKPAGNCPFFSAVKSSCIVLIEDLKIGDGCPGCGTGGIGRVGFNPRGDTDGAGGVFTCGIIDTERGSFGDRGFISPVGKFGGILISGVSGLGPLSFGRVAVGEVWGNGGVIDPEIGGFISSGIY